MKYNSFSKGSIWRKWDLQIHVPGAKHADQYQTEDGVDVWEKFIDYIKNSDVAVFGITDYFSIESYEIFQRKIKDIPELKNKTFFPCVEFRLDVSVNQDSEQLQCHLIFDSEYDINKIKNFLIHLPLKNKKSNGAVAYCTHDDIMACGGYDRVSITKEKLEKSLKDSFGNERPFLIAGVASGMGSNRADANSNIKKELSDIFDDFCDLFFGHEGNRKYFLKKDRYENKEKIAKAKPVISTSDCHTFDDCERKLGKKFVVRDQKGNDLERYGFSWIKADTTFEGLRQIIFEPIDRVAFGYEEPEPKKSYYIIDKVRFIDNTGQDNFLSDSIEINKNLTTIIGGKSTGKSLLLYYIAKTIDRKEVETRFADYPVSTQYNFDDSPNFNFEVVWADGESTYLKNVEGNNNSEERKILYIPQNYLNKLSEKNVKSRETLNKFVKDVLLQDDVIRENYENNLEKIKRLSKSIPAIVANIFQIKQEIEELEENIKQLGKESGIKKYIAQLQKEADHIKNKSGLSAQEIKDYETLIEKEKNTTTNIAILFEDKKTLIAFRQNLVKQLEDLERLRDEQSSYLGNEEIKIDFIKEFAGIDQIKKNLLISVDKIIASVDEKIKVNKKELEKIKKDLVPFMAKIKLQDELRKKNDAIRNEQKKLDKITLEKKSLESKKNLYDKEKKNLINTYKEIFSTYDMLGNEFKKYENKFEDISLNVSVGFNEQQFNEEVINNFLNKPDIKRNTDVAWKDEYEYQFDPSRHLNFINNLLNGVFDGKIRTIKGRAAKDAIVKILENYFDLDFKIAYKNDPLDKMSPGKKGLVLLRLLIDLSNEEWPILLDQPEDDLDNRSVYDDLVSFVKNKKKKRQIIIVTHNPNLVVGADAEQVIVANQEGQEKGRDNKKFKFEYVSGALENTFELSEVKEEAILFRKGIRQHVCEILEGGKEAFQKRERKYSFNS